MNTLLAAALALSLAQETLPRAKLRPITAPVREVALRVDRVTGRATRLPVGFVGSGAQPVYDNTCPPSYYLGLWSAAATGGSQAEAVVDQGRVPGTASAQTSTCTPGTADAYRITELEIEYCTTTGAPVTFVTHVFDRNGPTCPNVLWPVRDPTVLDLTVTGLPRSSAADVLACYTVTLDLGTPGFVLHGGASNAATERFAWSSQYPGTRRSDGPTLAGNLNVVVGCARCAGTIWERPLPTTSPGTGLGAADSLWVEQFGSTFTGCYFFEVAFNAFHLRLFATDPTLEPELGSGFCDGADGSHAACPCGATDPAAGCDNPTGTGVRLAIPFREFGPDTADFAGTGFPTSTTPAAVLIRSSSLEPAPVSFGDGLRCAGLAGFARVGATVATGGATAQTIAHGAGPGTFHYHLWYRSFPASYCVTTGPSSGAFNLSNGRSLAW